jgi:hypothetical protein
MTADASWARRWGQGYTSLPRGLVRDTSETEGVIGLWHTGDRRQHPRSRPQNDSDPAWHVATLSSFPCPQSTTPAEAGSSRCSLTRRVRLRSCRRQRPESLPPLFWPLAAVTIGDRLSPRAEAKKRPLRQGVLPPQRSNGRTAQRLRGRSPPGGQLIPGVRGRLRRLPKSTAAARHQWRALAPPRMDAPPPASHLLREQRRRGAPVCRSFRRLDGGDRKDEPAGERSGKDARNGQCIKRHGHDSGSR